MITDTEQTLIAPTVHRFDLKVDEKRHHAFVETQFNPAMTFAVAWASAIASLSAAVLAQTQLVTSAAARQMLGNWVSRPPRLQIEQEQPAAEGTTAATETAGPTFSDPPVTEMFDEVLELLVDGDIADSNQRGELPKPSGSGKVIET